MRLHHDTLFCFCRHGTIILLLFDLHIVSCFFIYKKKSKSYYGLLERLSWPFFFKLHYANNVIYTQSIGDSLIIGWSTRGPDVVCCGKQVSWWNGGKEGVHNWTLYPLCTSELIGLAWFDCRRKAIRLQLHDWSAISGQLSKRSQSLSVRWQ